MQNNAQRTPLGEMNPKNRIVREENRCRQFGQRTATATSENVKTLKPKGTPWETSSPRAANFAEHLGQVSNSGVGIGGSIDGPCPHGSDHTTPAVQSA